MARSPSEQFGKRRLPPPETPGVAGSKRSRNVALLVMGTLAVGGGAYALMPSDDCKPAQPGATAAAAQPCTSRSSSSSHYGGASGSTSSRPLFYHGSSSGHGSGVLPFSSSGGRVARGGFGGFSHSISAHFSGG